MSHSSTLTPSITPELTATLRRLKLGQLIDTLPERLALAKSSKMSYAEFLQLLLADEVSRRGHPPAGRQGQTAGVVVPRGDATGHTQQIGTGTEKRL